MRSVKWCSRSGIKPSSKTMLYDRMGRFENEVLASRARLNADTVEVESGASGVSDSFGGEAPCFRSWPSIRTIVYLASLSQETWRQPRYKGVARKYRST